MKHKHEMEERLRAMVAEREVMDAESRYMCDTGRSLVHYEADCMAQCRRLHRLMAELLVVSRERTGDQHELYCTVRCKQLRDVITEYYRKTPQL